MTASLSEIVTKALQEGPIAIGDRRTWHDRTGLNPIATSEGLRIAMRQKTARLVKQGSQFYATAR